MYNSDVGDPVSFLSIQKSKVGSDGYISVTGMMRDDNPEKMLVITIRHLVNGSETIEQLTLKFDEFYEIIEMVKDVEDRLYKAEEMIL